jgi:tetratricopeptide (TPR) repeat protein
VERPFPAYEGTEPFIFVCYAHDDVALVYPEIARLREVGFHIWYDEGISPGSEWSAELAERIQQCAVFLFFVTPRSVEREHCRAEVNFALTQRCKILSVQLEATAVPAALQLNLSHRQGILKFEHSPRAYERKLDRALQTAVIGRSIEREEDQAGVADTGDRQPITIPNKPKSRRSSSFRLLAMVGAVAIAFASVIFVLIQLDQPPGDSTTSVVVVGLTSVRIVGDEQKLQSLASRIDFDLAAEIDKTPLSVRTRVDNKPPPYLVETSLTRSEKQIAWTLQLLRTADGHLVWSKRRLMTERGAEDTVQNLAQYFAYMVRVAASLDSTVEGVSGTARQFFIDGVMEFVELAQGGDADWWAAERYLLDAIAADPEFRAPYGALGMLYKNRMGFQWTYSQAIGPAVDMASEMVANPDRTFLVGTINAQLELDFDAAVANFDSIRITDESRTHGEVEAEIGAALLWSGDLDGALKRFRSARRLDPGTNRGMVGNGEALARLASNDYRGALQLLDDSQAWLGGSAATNASAHLTRIRALFWSGKRSAAEAELDVALRLHGDEMPELFLGPMALVGRESQARALLANSEKRFSEGNLTIMFGAFWASFHLGELDQAFIWLDRVIENREFWFLPMFRHSEILDPIRQDPRFVKALSRLDAIEATGTAITTAAYP